MMKVTWSNHHFIYPDSFFIPFTMQNISAKKISLFLRQI